MVGEEDGGLGAFGTLHRGHGGDVCLIAEPTGGTLITANAGALTFRITVNGKAAHASSREQGVSAIDAYLPLHRALAGLESARTRAAPPPRVRLGEDPADARAQLEQCVAAACAADPWLREHPASVT